MFLGIVTGVLLMAAPAAQSTDTTFAVDPRGRLRIENLRGDLRVRVWDRPQVLVSADREDLDALRFSAAGSIARLSADSRGGHDEYEITIPATMALAILDANADVDIDGARGEVAIETGRGDLTLRGGAGAVSLRTTQGDITLLGARGRVDAHAASGDIMLDDVDGAIQAETISGDVLLRGIASSDVQASTVSGDVVYDGTVRDGGRYSLATHSGDVALSVPENANATLSIATFSGEFDTDIPVQLTDTGRRRFTLTLGSGSARVSVESFSGDVRLRRPGFTEDHR